VVVVYTQILQQAVEERSTLPDDWRNASTLSDWRCRLNPEQAERLINAVAELIEEFEEAEELPPDDEAGVPYTVMFQAFPRPGGRFGGTS
jgi:hypothetical protein